MNRTLIEWVKNPDGTQGYTWNPLTGCRNHVNGMCKGGGFPCYAYRLANGRLKQRYSANLNIALPEPHDEPKRAFDDPFYPRFWPDRIYDLRGEGAYDNAYPTRNAYHASREKEKGIFVCDMGDLFGIGIPEEWTKEVFEQIKIFSQHLFYLLTKQPQNLPKWRFPDNCWVGVTATNSEYARKGMIEFDFIEAKVKYLSIEPLLDSEGYTPWKYLDFSKVNWVIIGAQTKPSKYPRIEWVKEIVEAADRAGVKVFLKDNLRPLILDALAKHQIDRSKYLLDRELRQEIPDG